MDTIKVPKSSFKYNCIECNYTTQRKSQYDRHLLTPKHKRIYENIDNISNTFKSYKCDKCNNEYKFHSGLWKHKKTCTHTSNPTNQVTECNVSESHITDGNDNKQLSNTILMLVKQNQEFKQLMIDQPQKDLIINLMKENQEFKQLLIDQNKQMMEMDGG